MSIQGLLRRLYFGFQNQNARHQRRFPRIDSAIVESLEVRSLLTPVLVDLEAGAGSSNPNDFAEHNDSLYFRAGADTSGNSDDIWISNGAQRDSSLLIESGADGSFRDLTAAGDFVYFHGSVGSESDTGLFRTDGTVAGTTLILDTATDARGFSDISNLTAFNNRLFFTADTAAEGNELWSIGNDGLTSLVRDINPGVNSADSQPLGSDAHNLTVAGNLLYFVADDGSTGSTLWASDGTTQGTSLLQDINPNQDSSADEVEAAQLTAVGDRLFFEGDDGVSGAELWVTSGTTESTRLTTDIAPGSVGSTITEITDVNGTAFFVADDGGQGSTGVGLALWRSDGTTGGTAIISNINAEANGDFRPMDVTNVNGIVFAAFRDGETGIELWRSDGTEDGTILVADLQQPELTGGTNDSNPEFLTEVNGKLYFAATTVAEGTELWTSDGTEEGTVIVDDIAGPVGATGTTAGSSNPQHLFNFGDNLVFSADTSASGRELYYFYPNGAPDPSQDTITIDGDFSDWDSVTSYTDPVNDQHDTDSGQATDTPAFVDHPDVDLLEYKVSHDDENFYFYFRATGEIGRTQAANINDGLRAGRYYVIVTIDVDNDDSTGYALHEGGYYPTSDGYDLNAEIEFYDGQLNTRHYLNHGATNQEELAQAFADQSNGGYVFDGPETQGPFEPGFVNVLPGIYDTYTQWVYKENDPDFNDQDSVTFVQDKGPVVSGIGNHAVSADGHEMEMIFPYKGFLVDAQGNPIVGLGKTVDISFSLEASGELSNSVTDQAPNGEWASDTAEPIIGYRLTATDPQPVPEAPILTAPIGPIEGSLPLFRWTADENAATFDLLVTNTATDDVVLDQSGISGTFFQTTTPFADGAFEATLIAYNTNGDASLGSAPIEFQVGTDVVPDAPSILSPVGTIAIQSPLAEWSNVAFAQTYNLQVLNDDNVLVVNESGIDQTSFQLPALAEGSYQIQVQAVNSAGEASPFSLAVSFSVDIAAPERPVVLSPSSGTTSNAQPNFEWTTEGAATSTLWVGKVREGTGTAQVAAVYDRIIYVKDHIRGSYTWFNQLPGAGTYAVWAQNYNSVGDKSPWSVPVKFTLAADTPTTPVMNEIGDSDDRTPTISWNDQDAAYSYELWVNNLSSGEARVIHERTLVGTNQFTPDEDLAQGRYRAWVRATNSVGIRSAWSDSIIFNVDVLRPGQPELTAPSTSNGSGTDTTTVYTPTPNFEWDAVVSGARYELWVNRIDQRVTRIVHERQLTTETFTPAEQLPQGKYRAWVRAFNVVGEAGEWSLPYAFEIDIVSPTIPIITGPQTNAVGSVETFVPTITWTTTDANVTHQLQVEVVSSGERIIDETGITATQFTVPSRLPDTTYRTRVRNENSEGEVGEWSSWSTFHVDVPNATTPVPISPVSTVTTSDVTFEWQHTPGNIRYEIYVRDLLQQENTVLQVSNFELDLAQNRAVYTANGMEDGTFRWWVRAFNSQGIASSWSTALTFNVDAQVSLDTGNAITPLADAIDLAPMLRAVKPNSAEETLPHTKAAANDIPTPKEGNSNSDIALTTKAEEVQHLHTSAVMAEFADPAIRQLTPHKNDA